MDKDFQILIEEAKKFAKKRILTEYASCGHCGCALMTAKGNIYTGVCIDTASTLGMCAERNAIANMITNGESHITKLVCVTRDGSVGMPCGACREYLMQLDEMSKDIEILDDLATKKVVRLEELVPLWWGYERFKIGSD